MLDNQTVTEMMDIYYLGPSRQPGWEIMTARILIPWWKFTISIKFLGKGPTFIWFLPSMDCIFNCRSRFACSWSCSHTRNNLHAFIIHDNMDLAVNMRQCTDPALDNREKFKCLDCEVYGIKSLFCIGLCKINNNNLTALFIDNYRQYTTTMRGGQT